jgi:hypothetical protein
MKIVLNSLGLAMLFAIFLFGVIFALCAGFEVPFNWVSYISILCSFIFFEIRHIEIEARIEKLEKENKKK